MDIKRISPSWLWRFLQSHSLLILLAMFVIGVTLMIWQARTMQKNLVESAVLEQVDQYSQALAEVRSLYSSEIVSRLAEHGIEATSEYAGQEGTIPLPATFSILLGERLTENSSGGFAKIYSNYSWRATGGPTDQFGADALAALTADPAIPFYRFEEVDGRLTVRYATADIMHESCVACHNSQTDSPKQDWQVGDVRGVLEVGLPIDEAMAESQSGLLGLGTIIALFAVFILLTQTQITRANKRDLVDLEDQYATRTYQLTATNTQLQQEMAERTRVEAELLAERASLAQHVEERTRELSATNAELERVSKMKDEFLAAMSHELRTPLNAILGLSEALQDEVYGEVQLRQLQPLQRIEESGRHLLDLINDILDVSKIEAGGIDLDLGEIWLDEICNASLRLVKPDADAKRIKLMNTIAPDVTSFYADERRLKQILVNLLSNAIKFTPRKGVVHLNVAGDESGDYLQFSVLDSGIGIAPEDQERLFQPFIQVDSRLSRLYAGTGLGLTLVERLTRLHGGMVRVESIVGRGSRFTVTLPWQREPHAEQEPEQKIIYTHQNGSSPTPTVSPFEPTEIFFDKRPLILLAEDNELNIETIHDFLEFKGFRLRTARNGVQAVELAKLYTPDLILMDIQMPVMDGLEAIKQLRQCEPTQTIPIIALTGLAMPGDRERCLRAGANSYLSKPFGLDTLTKSIEKHLAVTSEFLL